MVFYVVFQHYFSHITSAVHIIHLSWVSPILGWGSELFCPWTRLRKTQKIQGGSNPGPEDYESNTLPQSHAGLLTKIRSRPNQEHLLPMQFYSSSHDHFCLRSSKNMWKRRKCSSSVFSPFTTYISKSLLFRIVGSSMAQW